MVSGREVNCFIAYSVIAYRLRYSLQLQSRLQARYRQLELRVHYASCTAVDADLQVARAEGGGRPECLASVQLPCTDEHPTPQSDNAQPHKAARREARQLPAVASMVARPAERGAATGR